MNVSSTPVYYSEEYLRDKISHHVVRLKVEDGICFYLVEAERLVGYDIPYDLVWTTRLRDAKQYTEVEAVGIVKELQPEKHWQADRFWETKDDNPESIEGCVSRLRKIIK